MKNADCKSTKVVAVVCFPSFISTLIGYVAASIEFRAGYDDDRVTLVYVHSSLLPGGRMLLGGIYRDSMIAIARAMFEVIGVKITIHDEEKGE